MQIFPKKAWFCKIACSPKDFMYPNLQIFLQDYIRHIRHIRDIRDILQLWQAVSHKTSINFIQWSWWREAGAGSDQKVPLKSKGVPPSPKSVVFLNIVQKAVDPPLVLNMTEQIFLMDFLKSA